VKLGRKRRLEEQNGVSKEKIHKEQEWSKEGKGDMESRSGVVKEKIHVEQEWSK
jgi:hypothetical protein